MNIYLIIGLPGSGKTTWIEKNRKQYDNVFDDISQMTTPLENLEKIMKSSTSGDIFISDVNFSKLFVLKTAEDWIMKNNLKYNITYVFSKCSKEQAIKNVHFRNDGRYVLSSIEIFSKSIPEVEDYINTKDNKIILEQNHNVVYNKFK